MTGNQNKRHGLNAQIVLRVRSELKAKLVAVAQASSKPNNPLTPSDVARAVLEAHFNETKPTE